MSMLAERHTVLGELDFRCAGCGYQIATAEPHPLCPMCGLGSWSPITAPNGRKQSFEGRSFNEDAYRIVRPHPRGSQTLTFTHPAERSKDQADPQRPRFAR